MEDGGTVTTCKAPYMYATCRALLSCSSVGLQSSLSAERRVAFVRDWASGRERESRGIRVFGAGAWRGGERASERERVACRRVRVFVLV